MRRLCFQTHNQWCYFEITIRCQHARFLMHPSKTACSRILGVLGRSLELYGGAVRLHLAGGTSNHIHLIVSSYTSMARANFKCHLKTNLSKELGDLYGWREHLFGRRSCDIQILDERALRDRLRYVMAHGVKEGLVSRKEGWPGIPWVAAVTKGQPLWGEWFDRTQLAQRMALWRAKKEESRGPKPCLADVLRRIPVILTPLVYMENMSESEQRDEWRRIFDEAMECYPEQARPLGTKALLRQNPHTKPAHPKRSPAPKVHARDPEKRRLWIAAYRGFVATYRDVWQRLAADLAKFADLEEPILVNAYRFPPEGIPPARVHSFALCTA